MAEEPTMRTERINKFGRWMMGFIRKYNKIVDELNRKERERRGGNPPHTRLRPYFEDMKGNPVNFYDCIEIFENSKDVRPASVMKAIPDMYFTLTDKEKAHLGVMCVVDPELIDDEVLYYLDQNEATSSHS